MEWNKIEKLINLQDFEHIDKDVSFDSNIIKFD